MSVRVKGKEPFCSSNLVSVEFAGNRELLRFCCAELSCDALELVFALEAACESSLDDAVL